MRVVTFRVSRAVERAVRRLAEEYGNVSSGIRQAVLDHAHRLDEHQPDFNARVVGLIRDLIPFLEKALARFEKNPSKMFLSACLDCRKVCLGNVIGKCTEPCVMGDHTTLDLEAYGGPTDVTAALTVLKWVLRQAESGVPSDPMPKSKRLKSKRRGGGQ